MVVLAAETVRIEIPVEIIDETLAGVQSAARNLEKLKDAADRAGSSTDRARQRVTKFDRAQEKTQRSLSKWAKQKYAVILEAKERLSPVLSSLGIKLKNLTSRTWKITMRAFDLVTSPVRGILNILRNPIFQAGAVLGVSIGLKDTIDTYKYFESTMSQVKAISGATGAEFDKLEAKAKEMGAATKFTAAETAEAFTYMGMAGWKPQEMLDGIEGILNLAAASGEELSTTSDIITDALSAFHLTAADSGHFADVLAQASANANTNVSMMGESFKYVASVAGAMKYSVEDVSLALGLMANSGVKSSMAGTALKTSLVNMAKPTDKMAAAMDKYGVSLTDKGGKMKTLKGLMDNLRKRLGGLSEAEQTAAAGTIFGKEAMAGMLSIINTSEKDYNKLTKAVNNADGASKKMADTMLDNLEGSITLFQSALDGVKLSLGERLSPYVRSIADGLAAAMPDVEKAMDSLMDKADIKISQLKNRFKEISLKDGWQEADFFGKVSIAWDEFIAQPFAEWWDGTGKAKTASAMGDFGSLLGSGLHAGIMTLLGFDISDTLDEGASIGKSFAKGFSEGFDLEEISSKLWEELGNIVKNAGKIMPGGEKADLSSWLSAALLAKIAKPVLGIGSGVAGIGRALFTPMEAAGGASLMGSLIGSAGAGTGLLGLGSKAAIGLGAGNLAGGASLSAGALSAVGLGSIAGGIAGGASLFSGFKDWYTAATEKDIDPEKKIAYNESGSWKIGGVAGGALAGAAIGSVVPVLGTAVGGLVGAGVGGIAGLIKGNSVKKEYEEKQAAAEAEAKAEAEKIQKAYAVTGRSIEDIKFKTENLKNALEDTNVTTEEFALMLQEAVSGNVAGHFGDVSLSLEEIKKAASGIVFDRQAKGMEKFNEASQKSGESLKSFQDSARALQRMDWEMGISTKLRRADKENYREMAGQFADEAKAYLENQHYEATVALSLLAGKDSSGMEDGLDSMYSRLQKKVKRYSKKLDAKIKVSMKDGVIDINEQEEITRLQQKISDITQKVASAQEKASFASMKIKYSGAALSQESFAGMQEEIKNNVESMSGNYDNALQVSLSNLQLQLDEGAVDEDAYKELYQKIADGYNKQMEGLNGRALDFQLDAIADAYKEELENILPDIEGGTSEWLKEAMEKAIAVKPDAQQWTPEEITKWFGLGNLDTVTQEAVSGLLQKTAETVPDSVAGAFNENYQQTVSENIQQILGNPAFDSQFMEAGTSYGQSLTTGASDSILSGFSLLRTSAQTSLDNAFSSPFSVTASVNVTPEYKLNGSFNIPGLVVSGKSTPSGKPSPSKHAAGGYVGTPQISWLAEEGYGEYVIPTNPGRRRRALELYEQAGRALGVGRHAEGGFVTPGGGNRTGSMFNGSIDDGYSGEAGAYPANIQDNGDNGTVLQGININVQMSPQVTVNVSGGHDGGKIAEAVMGCITGMADRLCGEIAARIEESFSNMPAEGVQI